MGKYNIYRIKKGAKEELVEKLTSVGLDLISEIESDGFSLQFFFSKEPDEIDIWWVETYQTFLVDIEPPKNKIYFGALLLTGDDVC